MFLKLHTTSDNALMENVKNGDLDKLGLLFERYNRRLFGFFYRLTFRRDVSEDLVSGVFERILKYRTSYSSHGDFSAWIFRIARNIYSDYYRENKKLAVDHSETDWDSLPGSNQMKHAESDEEMNRKLVQRALEKLDSEKKQVLILSRFEGFRYREIAGIMDCTEAAVKVRVFRALNEMKEIISVMKKQEEL